MKVVDVSKWNKVTDWKKVKASGVSEDDLIHTWDIDISSHNGKQFIGFFGSRGEIRVYKLWLQA